MVVSTGAQKLLQASDLSVFFRNVTTSAEVVTFLKNTLKSEACKSFWAPVETTIAEQKAALEKARAFAKEGKWKEALEQYDLVLSSKVQVAEFYDDAVREEAK